MITGESTSALKEEGLASMPSLSSTDTASQLYCSCEQEISKSTATNETKLSIKSNSVLLLGFDGTLGVEVVRQLGSLHETMPLIFTMVHNIHTLSARDMDVYMKHAEQLIEGDDTLVDDAARALEISQAQTVFVGPKSSLDAAATLIQLLEQDIHEKVQVIVLTESSVMKSSRSGKRVFKSFTSRNNRDQISLTCISDQQPESIWASSSSVFARTTVVVSSKPPSHPKDFKRIWIRLHRRQSKRAQKDCHKTARGLIIEFCQQQMIPPNQHHFPQ